MNIMKYITVIVAAALLSGCITEEWGACTNGNSGAVSIKLSVSAGVPYADGPTTRASVEEDGFGAENSLKDIVIMVFSHSADASGTLEVCERFDLSSLPAEQDRWLSESILLVDNVTGLDDPKNVYVIANWTGYTAGNYAAGATAESVLLAELASISGPIATPTAVIPMLMSGGIVNHVFADNANKASVGLARQAAKIRLRVEYDEDFTDFYGSRLTLGGTAGDVKMRAVNVPNRSYVMRKTPAAAPSSANVIHYPFTRAMDTFTTPAAYLADSCYVFENPVAGNLASSRAAATSLILNIPFILDGQANTNNYYRIYIDNTAENAADPYPVLRNYIYDIKTRVKGFGLPEELAVPDALESEVTITPWSDIEFSTDLETDDSGGNLDGDIDPWDPNGGSDGDIGSEDPEGEIDDTDNGNTIDPWDPNNGGIDL